jgi:hypothetical protein
VVERPCGGRAARTVRHQRLSFPDPREGAQRRVHVIRVEIEDGLEEHERHAVEADRVVAEPAPREPRRVSAPEAVLRRPFRVGVVQVALNRPLAPGRLRGPVRDDLAIDPRHDRVAGVVLQRRDQPAAGGRDRSAALDVRASGGGTSRARAARNSRQHEARETKFKGHGDRPGDVRILEQGSREPAGPRRSRRASPGTNARAVPLRTARGPVGCACGSGSGSSASRPCRWLGRAR